MTVLDAWLYGVHVAVLRATATRRVVIEYTDQALARWGVVRGTATGAGG